MIGNSPRLQSVHRAIADLRRGAMVLVRADDGESSLISAAEQVTDERLSALASTASSTPSLLISPQRGQAIGLKPRQGSRACSVLLSPQFRVEHILGLIGDMPFSLKPDDLTVLAEKADSLADLVLVLMRVSRLLPAAIASRVSIRDERALLRWAEERGILVVDASAIDAFEADQASLLREAARASLPLADAPKAEIALFRPLDGGLEHFALLIHPENDTGIVTPPMVRIHSQCITGDILGSLKCDCGTQLREAIRQMAQGDGGVLIYLAQEGRDIGLVNKLKAYALQDGGLDTVDANHELGFETDHRFSMPAAEMLRQLGYQSVRLLTNNPDKISQVEDAGISVAERMPLVVETNPHNEGYLATKKSRTGHLID